MSKDTSFNLDGSHITDLCTNKSPTFTTPAGVNLWSDSYMTDYCNTELLDVKNYPSNKVLVWYYSAEPNGFIRFSDNLNVKGDEISGFIVEFDYQPFIVVGVYPDITTLVDNIRSDVSNSIKNGFTKSGFHIKELSK